MCVIIIKQTDKQLSKTILRTSSRINPHGLGIVWLDTYETTYHKSSDWKKLVTNRPFIAHFRFATKGKINKANTHPFVCGKNKHELLMHNGTIPNIGTDAKSDSRMLAEYLGDMPRHSWATELAEYDSRFVTINTRTRTFQIYNKELWTKQGDVWYSKNNVIKDNLVAVYGTLKKGNSNYYHYLRNETFIGKGKTTMKYPMIVPGLPYVIDKPGKGHLIDIDLFAVSNTKLQELDRLEGHPTHYKRREITVLVKGRVYKAWLYFGQGQEYKGKQLHSSYEKTYPKFTLRDRSYTYADSKEWTPWWRQEEYLKETESVASDTQCFELNYNQDSRLCPDCSQATEQDPYSMEWWCHSCQKFETEEVMKQFKI
jgi:gamma-glutamylaminecyclotransferase